MVSIICLFAKCLLKQWTEFSDFDCASKTQQLLESVQFKAVNWPS